VVKTDIAPNGANRSGVLADPNTLGMSRPTNPRKRTRMVSRSPTT
jgi:hypothetical protein